MKLPLDEYEQDITIFQNLEHAHSSDGHSRSTFWLTGADRNLQLRAMQQRLADIHDLGAELVAISPEVPDGSLSQDEQAGLKFPVLSDQDAQVAAEYGIAWNVPQLILEHMQNDRNLELAKLNGGNGSVLPILATFVLNREGVVTWRFVDVDYRNRAEPDDIVEALRAL